jgi:polar amino acid transport system permease protein
MHYVFQFGDVFRYWDTLLKGALTTLVLTIATTGIGVAIGIVGAAGRTSGSRLWGRLALAYVEFIRNTPFIIQLFFVYFGLPSFGVKLSAETAAVIALSLSLGAYATEIIRSGIEGIAKGQREAGIALGLTGGQVFFLVILKPAIGKVYPALTSQIVLVMLGSAAVSQIAAEDLTFAAQYIQAQNFRSFEVYLVATLAYLALAIILRHACRLVGRRLFRTV